MTSIVSAAPKPPSVEQLELPAAGDDTELESGLALVPEVPEIPEELLEGLFLEPAARVRPIDVVMCCAQVDLPSMGRIFDALQRHDCAPVAMTGVECDPRRLTESALSAGRPRLYVVCKTPAVDSTQARRLVQAFARAGRRGRHQLLVLEVDVTRIYAAVPHIRRGADQLRRRLHGPGVDEAARTVEVPRVAPGHPLVPPIPRAMPRRAEQVDTSYAIHGPPGGPGEVHIDRIIIDIDPRPAAPTGGSRVSQRATATKRRDER